jgi:hypothetical protein
MEKEGYWDNYSIYRRVVVRGKYMVSAWVKVTKAPSRFELVGSAVLCGHIIYCLVPSCSSIYASKVSSRV